MLSKLKHKWFNVCHSKVMILMVYSACFFVFGKVIADLHAMYYLSNLCLWYEALHHFIQRDFPIILAVNWVCMKSYIAFRLLYVHNINFRLGFKSNINFASNWTSSHQSEHTGSKKTSVSNKLDVQLWAFVWAFSLFYHQSHNWQL